MGNYIDRKVRQESDASIGGNEIRFRMLVNSTALTFAPLPKDLSLPDLDAYRLIHTPDGELYLMNQWGLAQLTTSDQGLEVTNVGQLADFDTEFEDIRVSVTKYF